MNPSNSIDRSGPSPHDLLQSCKRELEGSNPQTAIRLLLQLVENQLVNTRQDHNSSSDILAQYTRTIHSDDNALQLEERGTKRKPVVACNLCRMCKSKCITSEPGTGKCDRCNLAGGPCVFERHKRGRKR
jgi:hypothetical protein